VIILLHCHNGFYRNGFCFFVCLHFLLKKGRFISRDDIYRFEIRNDGDEPVVYACKTIADRDGWLEALTLSIAHESGVASVDSKSDMQNRVERMATRLSEQDEGVPDTVLPYSSPPFPSAQAHLHI
jgi:hypothetical protein